MLTHRLCIFLLLYSIALGSISCEDDSVHPPLVPDWAHPIDSQIQIVLSEVLSPNEQQLRLQCRTEKIYECFNYHIAATVARGRAVIQISFDYIEPPVGACFFATGPATKTIDLGPIPAGMYPLRLLTPNGNVEGQLIVEEGAYRVTISSGSAVSLTNPILRRVPDGTVWGLIGYLSPFNIPAVRAQAFLDSLEAHGAVYEPLEPGTYGSFMIDSAFVMHWPPNHGYYVALPYHYRSTRDPTELREVVRQFAYSDSQWLSIQMHTWRGESYWGFLLNDEPQP